MTHKPLQDFIMNKLSSSVAASFTLPCQSIHTPLTYYNTEMQHEIK